MFGGRGINGQPSFNAQRSRASTQQRPFQVRRDEYDHTGRNVRYSISPPRDSRRSRTPVKMYANIVDSRQTSGKDSWRGRNSISPQRGRSRSFERRGRSRSLERGQNQRGRNYSPRGRGRSRSPSPVINRRYSRSHSRSPPRNWRQQQQFSPQQEVRFQYSPLPVDAPQRDIYAQNNRRRSRSGSNMDISSNNSSPSSQMFRSTFQPIEPKKTKKIKISVPKDLPRDESSPEVEVGFRGYKIRNAPDVDEYDSKRTSRWDTSAAPLPSTKEILERQGVLNPDEALKKIANLPTMDLKFKSQINDDDAVKEQLRLLDQERRMQKLRENLPPSIGLPSSLTFSAIGKTGAKNSNVISTTSANTMMPINNNLVTSKPSNLPSVNVPSMPNFPPAGFPPFGMQGNNMLPPSIGMPPNFNGPPPNVPTSMSMPFGMPPSGFGQPGMGMLPPPIGMPPNFSGPPPMGMQNIPSVSSAHFMPPVSNAYMGVPDVVKFNLTNIGPPPMQQPQMQQIDPTEAIFQARADLYRRDLSEIRSIPDLMKYMWSQGFDPIPTDDPPLLFNEVVKGREGILGAGALYQIICYGHPEMETYYCAMCNHWTTVSEMFNHLTASMHRMNFLARNYKLFHKKAEDHQDLAERDKFLDFICKKVWKIDGSGSCVNRMRCILNIDAIKQVWPNYFEYTDNSWRILGSKDSLDEMLTSGRAQSSHLDEQPVQKTNQYDNQASWTKGKIMIKPSLNTVLSRDPIGELEKVAERSRERKRSRSRSHKRSSKRSRSRRSRSSSRKRESRRSRSPRHSKSSKNEWERKTNEFITRINNDGISSALNAVSATTPNSKQDDSNKASLRRKETNDAEQDQARLTRQALGALLEIQHLHDKQGSIPRSMVYAVAAEMGLTKDDVHRSRILKQGLETMNVVNEASEQQKSVLESLGIAQADLKKLLSSVSSSSKADDVSMVYPEVGSDNVFANSIRTAIHGIKQKMNDPQHAHMRSELQGRLDHLEMKLSQELGVTPAQKSNIPPSNRSRPTPGAQPLPGAWRNRAMAAPRDNMAQRGSVRRETQGQTPPKKEDNKFDPSKVEAEWTDYFLKDPSKIEEVNNPTDKHTEDQYDSYYGPGTYVAFVAARRRAAHNARRALASSNTQKKYFEDFSV